MLILNNISKYFGAFPALKSLEINFTPGKTTILIGPSGCGKSTLLKLCIGLLKPDTGFIKIDSKTLSTENIDSFRHRMGYVIQEGGLFPHLTAFDNVALLLRYLKWPLNHIEQRILELADLTQFPKELLDRFPRELSGGQRQRVSLIRALMPDPEILLLDEPLGALDPMIRADLQQDLRSIFARLHKTVILVTHDMAEAAYFGDEIILMRAGEIVQKGPLSELMESPASEFVQKFIQAQRHRVDFSGKDA